MNEKVSVKTMPFLAVARSCLFFSIFVAGLVQGVTTDPWINTAYSYRIEITNLNPAFGQPLKDFPFLISITNNYYLKNSQNIDANGIDLTFANPDGQQLFHQIENFNRSTGTLVAWVCIPSFTNSTRIYLYYNFDALKSPTGIPFTGSNTFAQMSGFYTSLTNTEIQWNTWDPEFLCVYHFNESSGRFNYDSTRTGAFGTNFTNITFGSNGIGNSKGFFSVPGRGIGGVKTSSFKSTGTALYESIRSNTLTHSLWFRHSGNLTNNVPYYTNVVSNYISGYSTNVTASLFGIKTSGSFGSDDGKGVLTVNKTNVLRYSFADVATDAPQSMALHNATNTNTEFGMHSNWFYYGLSATNLGATRALQLIVNDVAANLSSGTAFGTTTTIGDLYVAGGEDATSGGSTGVPNTNILRFSPWGIFDEYRLSRSVRSSNWLISEFSNVILMTNMARDHLCNPEPLMTCRITNFDNFPSITAGGTLSLGLDNNSLVVPDRPPLFLTNIAWSISNLSNASVISSNFVYASDTNLYSFTYGGIPAGDYLASVVLTSDDSTGAPVSYRFTVGTESYYDLRYYRVIGSNNGILVDLFRGQDGGNARPTETLIFRDGEAFQSLFTNLGGGRYHDSVDLFYDEAHTYLAAIQYSNAVYFTNSVTMVPAKATVTASVPTTGGVLENLELKATFPSGSLSSAKTMSISFPSDVVGIDGYRQMVLDDGNGVYDLFAQPISLRLKVRLSGGSITVPGTTKRLVLNDAGRLRLGYWDGFQWNSLPTTLVTYSNRVELSTMVTREGRFSLLFNDGSSAGVEAFRIRNRVLVPGSSDTTYGSIFFGWDKGVNEKASVSVLTHQGRLVYQKKDMLDPFWIWDGRGSDDTYLNPGLYIYQVQVGTTKTYRGTLAIMAK